MWVVFGVGLFAQGTVEFNNSPSALGGIGAPIFDIDGTTKLAGARYLAQLYGGPDAGSLAPCGLPLFFRTGAGAGYFSTGGGIITMRAIPGAPSGERAAIIVRVWEAAGGETYEEARAGGYKHGSSTLFTVATSSGGTPPTLPSKLVGLTSFSLIPEPSIFAMIVVGVAVLMACGGVGRQSLEG